MKMKSSCDDNDIGTCENLGLPKIRVCLGFGCVKNLGVEAWMRNWVWECGCESFSTHSLGGLAAGGSLGLELLDDVKTLNNLSENNVLAVEPATKHHQVLERQN